MYDTKHAIVTGGSSGIGKAIANILYDLGLKVTIFDIHKPEERYSYFSVDIRDELEIQKAFSGIEHLDILVNCAGIYFQKPIENTSKEDIDKMVDTNIKGSYLMCKYALPLLKEKGGSVINISSSLGIVTEPNSSLYSMTKSALIMLSKSMAIDYEKYDIRTNAILPGAVDTPLLREYLDTNEKVERHGAKKPLGRVANPSDIANMVEFLISDKAKFINGAIISVDGGEACTSLYSKFA
jgi:NAD(P)-dependent dehydrogenase (short-subunit alcohol dehydrogenase family)